MSLQDLKGSIRFGGVYQKLDEVADLTWDVLIIDEAHEGVDTFKTDVAFDHIKRRFTLHLSGTPFKPSQTRSSPTTPSTTGPMPTSSRPSVTGLPTLSSRTPTPTSPSSTCSPTR